MKIYCTCAYCGNKWDMTFWTQQAINTALIICDICKDRDIRMVPDSEWDRDPFGYNKAVNEPKKTRST
jgi:hypothetical protein